MEFDGQMAGEVVGWVVWQTHQSIYVKYAQVGGRCVPKVGRPICRIVDLIAEPMEQSLVRLSAEMLCSVELFLVEERNMMIRGRNLAITP